MTIRFLINDDGNSFKSSEIQTLRKALDSLGDGERMEYRNRNASTIANHGIVKFLIVSGPGTGKSYLFLNKINNWYKRDKDANVFVTSFVRKLVADLQSDIERDKALTHEQKTKIAVSTLHKFARSIVERNHGTAEWSFNPHFRIIGQSWEKIVWEDVLAFYSGLDRDNYAWKKFKEQLHNANFNESNEWQNLKETYFKLCQFYNAAGFADLILRATEALRENSNLNENKYFIVDEYQDFNLAEEALIVQLINNPNALLVVGDDEQVLYEKLKSSKPTLIRNLYQNKNYAKGMLPFCSRSSFHITKTADHFIQHLREAECIEKIYLPLKTDSNNPKVQVIACATPSTAVDYIEKFIVCYKAAIEERKNKLTNGEEKDAFLLILSPAKEAKFYGKSKEKLECILAEYRVESRYFSEDYYKILNYYSLSNNPQNNFTFRKVFHYENISPVRTHELIDYAMRNKQNFCDLELEEIKTITLKCNEVRAILEAKSLTIEEKVKSITQYIFVTDENRLKEDLTKKSINKEEIAEIEHKEEEEAELEEIEVKKMGAVELITIVGSKGLSADHVIIVGFDNINMNWITKNAFYVAMTRARKSLHIITALKSGGSKRTHGFLQYLPEEHAEFYSYKKKKQTKKRLNGKKEFINYLDLLNSVSRDISVTKK